MGCAIGAVRVKGGTVPGGVAAGYVVGAMGPVGCATGAVRAKGGTVFSETAEGATEPVGGAMGTGHRLMCARGRSTAAIAATVTASTIWCKEGGGGVSVRGIYHTGVRGARGQALRYAGPKYSWRKRWCVNFMFRSMEYNKGYLPSVLSSSLGARAGVAIPA